MKSSKRAIRLAGAVWVTVAATATAVFGQSIVTGSVNITEQLKLVTTVTNSSGGAPNFGVHSGNNRFLYVGEQNGRIRTLDFSQPNPLLATDFLNIDSILGATLVDDTGSGERGLLGAAFHPDFNNASNPSGFRKFYTFTSETYASATPHFFHQAETPTYNHQSVIREWTASAPDGNGVQTINTSVASRVVMRIAKPGPFHNGGGITFGADGYMYVPLGDGGGGNSNGGNDGGTDVNANQGHTNPGNPDSPGAWTGAGNAQDRRNVYGKILRIKPTTDADANTNASPIDGAGWRVPKSNPFTLDTNPANPANFVDEIYAYGFRNPFRISFDKDSPSNLYAADVGQDRNTFSREEVSRIFAGSNYGWVAKSGTEANTSASASGYTTSVTLTDPIAQYPTTQLGGGGLAVIGGFVYRGELIPELFGKYVFGDLNRGTGTGGRLLYTDFDDPALTVFELNITGAVAKPNANVHGVAEGADGEIYFLFSNGQVMALVPEPSSGVAFLVFAAFLTLARRRQFPAPQK